MLAIVAEVVPCQWPDARFKRLDPNWHPGADYTTCGALPLYVGIRLGDAKGITQGGVDGLRDVMKARGAWVVANGKNRPGEGDFYGFSEVPGGVLTHVGVFVSRRVVNGQEVWTTADAGQGGAQQGARYVERVYDPRTNTLSRPGMANSTRYFAGWGDIARVPIVRKAATSEAVRARPRPPRQDAAEMVS